MYYNPRTKKLLDTQHLRNFLNVSFPEGTSKIQNWYLLDQTTKLPALESGQIAVKDKIVKEKGSYVQTYKVENINIQQENIVVEDIDKIKILENSILDIAQMVSNLEEYRQSFEARLEQLEGRRE